MDYNSIIMNLRYENVLLQDLNIQCFFIFLSLTTFFGIAFTPNFMKKVINSIRVRVNNILSGVSDIVETNSFDPYFSGYSLNAFQSTKPITNVSPGPTQFPKVLLHQIEEDLMNSQHGISPLEISHRSPEFAHILSSVNENMKKLMKIPNEFTILWMHGGGHGQFSAVPLNLIPLISNNKRANYMVSGTWSQRAFDEACKVTNAYDSFNHDPPSIKHKSISADHLKIADNDAYVYFCSNETVNGTEFRKDGIPYPCRDTLKTARSIIDMSSDFTMKKIDWTRVDVAFACTSKNLGLAGATVTIIRTELLDSIEYNKSNYIPSVMDWKLYYNTNSLYNTPAVYNIYIVDKFLKYYIKKGGIDVLEEESKIKSSIIYELLDESSFYSSLVSDKLSRSNINIPFFVGDGNREIRSKFLHFCYMNNIVGLRTKTPFRYHDYNMIEPLRVNLYNGVSIDETKKLVNVMKRFEDLFT
jgi:phosphoserine aminotransferase